MTVREHIIKSLTMAWAKIKSLCVLNANVVNSTSGSSTTYPLSAAAGADLQNQINTLNSALGSHNHDSRYYTESEINTKINSIRGKIGTLNTPGYFPTYNDSSHNIGITFANLSDSVILRSVIDGNFIDLVPNNKSVNGNYKIMDVIPAISNGKWILTFNIYVDGRIYSKYVNLN